MLLTKYKPFLDESIFKDLDLFFNGGNTIGKSSDFTYTPYGDIIETDASYDIEVALAGFEKKDIDVSIEDDVLTITGERKKEERKYNRQETFFGKVRKQYTLPKNIQTENLKAKFENGLLKLSIPKDTKKLLNSKVAIE